MLTSNTNSQSETSVLGLINATTASNRELLPSSLADKQTKFSKLFADLLPGQTAMRAGGGLSSLTSDMESFSNQAVSKQEWADALNDLVAAYKDFMSETGSDKVPQGVLLAQNAVTNLARLNDVKGLNEVLADYGVTSVDDYMSQSLATPLQENIAADELNSALDNNLIESLASAQTLPTTQDSAKKNLGFSVSDLVHKALHPSDVKSYPKSVNEKAEAMRSDHVIQQLATVSVDELGVDATDAAELLETVAMPAEHSDDQVKDAIQSLGQYIRDIAKQHGKPVDADTPRVSVADAVHAYQAQYGRAMTQTSEQADTLTNPMQGENGDTAMLDESLGNDINALLKDSSDNALEAMNKVVEADAQNSVQPSSDMDKLAAEVEGIAKIGQSESLETQDDSLAALSTTVESVIEKEAVSVDTSSSDKSVKNTSLEDEPLQSVNELAKSLQQNHAVASTQAASASQAPAATASPSANSVSQAASQAQANQTVTAWGNTHADGSQNASSNGQSQQQSSQQQSSQQWQAQQQLIQVQENLRNKSTALQQQQAVKNADELARADANKELLATTDTGSLERRAQLPNGLQSISVPVRSPQWGQALGQRVVFMANNNLQQAKITLNPEHLGPVQVKLQLGKDQQMHVTMHAQHLTTREAMENAMPRLKEMLEQAGIDVASVTVGEEESSNDTGSAFADAEDQQGSGGAMAGSDIDADIGNDEMQVVQSDNLVDYYA
ncbi:flagellar hook-length control protein FliK [Thiomicrorhabdus sediminis]|uniref:Flagellar hook-length control protein FliK n=1 Tax=Thiomicrorhabdus sediminis TaxID=2580412 RepID=A0A4P9K632_9GAMM|nr:flagellar hook-length control protein FliK [Thiomicrorhabdus sediminis]QCU90449.1 flagellar hook-length control protein FliK [Thiomicrorhabdus sediminis]